MDENLIAESINRLRKMIAVLGTVAVAIVLFIIQKNIVHTVLIYLVSIIIAVFFVALAKQVRHVIKVNYPLALALVIVGFLGVFFLLGWIIGPSLVSQAGVFIKNLPSAIKNIREFLSQYPWGQSLSTMLAKPSGFGINIMSSVTGVFSSSTEAVSQALFVLLMAVFMAFDPHFYLKNAIRIFYPSRRDRLRRLTEAISHSLHQWMIGRAIAMGMIAVFTYIGLLIAGVPLALSLAVLAGLLDVVPFIGPLISAVPAILVAFAAKPVLAVYVIIIYLAAHITEDLISPIILRQIASIPPALLISVQILLTMLAGWLGLFMAEPLCIIGIVTIQLLYFRDILGENVQLLGEKRY